MAASAWTPVPDTSAWTPVAAVAPLGKSFVQKAQDEFDKLTHVTPEQEKGHSALVNRVQEFGAGAIQGVGAPIVHPMDTLESVGNTIAHPIDTAHAEVDELYKHPAQFAGNVAGGAILGEAAAPLVKPIATALKTAAERAALLGKTPEAAYQSALKPAPSMGATQQAAIVRTGLDQGIPVSKGGLEKLSDHIDTLNQAIKDEIAADPNRPIDPNKVANRADDAKAKFANQVNAGGDLKAIEASKKQFLSEQGAKSGKPAPAMNADDAQAMKQGTYRVLRGKFGEQGSASVEAQKALARGLKEEIATQFPEIGKLNADESRLIDLQPVLERAVGRISNHQGIGIGTPIAGAATTAITGSGGLGAAASVLKGVLDNPSVKSRLAIAVSKSQKIPIGQAIQKVNAYSAGLGASVAASQASSSDGTQDQPDTQ